jgi:cytochrome c oxidase subunit 4
VDIPVPDPVSSSSLGEAAAMAGLDAEHTAHDGPALPIYYAIFGTLIGLTLLTVGAAYASFIPNSWHTPVALIIAAAKATLVVLFFMHLWYSPRLTWLVATGSLLWVAIMFALTFADFLTRA